MCVLMGHPGMRLGVPSRCGNFFCWGNSGWRRWILLNSAILNSDTKICFFPPPSWAESQVWIFARSLSSREQKWDFPNPILRVFPVLLHSLQDPVPAMPGELPTARIVPGKRNFGDWSTAEPKFLTHQGLQVNFGEFWWILMDWGSSISYPPGPAGEFWWILLNFTGFWWILAPGRALLCRAWEHPQSRSPKELDSSNSSVIFSNNVIFILQLSSVLTPPCSRDVWELLENEHEKLWGDFSHPKRQHLHRRCPHPVFKPWRVNCFGK